MFPAMNPDSLMEWADELDVQADEADLVLASLNDMDGPTINVIKADFRTDAQRYRRRAAFLRRVAAAVLNSQEIAAAEQKGQES
jgi:hypothetical protein